MVESLGISVFRVRLVIFVIAALLAGLSGWLYAHMSRYVSPAPFDLRMGIQYLFMAILGGAGHILGAVVGAALLTLLQNTLQDVLPHFSRNGQQLEVVVFAVIYVLALQFARGGVMPFVLRYLPRRAKPAITSGRAVATTDHAASPARRCLRSNACSSASAVSKPSAGSGLRSRPAKSSG